MLAFSRYGEEGEGEKTKTYRREGEVCSGAILESVRAVFFAN